MPRSLSFYQLKVEKQNLSLNSDIGRSKVTRLDAIWIADFEFDLKVVELLKRRVRSSCAEIEASRPTSLGLLVCDSTRKEPHPVWGK
jgi:hypothetical protein